MLLTDLTLFPSLLKAGAKTAWTALRAKAELDSGRAAAVKAFRAALLDSGVPATAVEDLIGRYPKLDLPVFPGRQGKAPRDAAGAPQEAKAG